MTDEALQRSGTNLPVDQIIGKVLQFAVVVGDQEFFRATPIIAVGFNSPNGALRLLIAPQTINGEEVKGLIYDSGEWRVLGPDWEAQAMFSSE